MYPSAALRWNAVTACDVAFCLRFARMRRESGERVSEGRGRSWKAGVRWRSHLLAVCEDEAGVG